jgi:L-ornithine Nalpha-acyltransferase
VAAEENGVNIQSPLARPGALKIRLAQNDAEMRVAQRLRYLVFHCEMRANLPDDQHLAKIETDGFDVICDHLLVIAPAQAKHADLAVEDGVVVGTYRLLRQRVAEQHQGFYSQSEFDVARLLERHAGLQFLELGRSCVLPAYRGSAVVDILWQGIWNYVRHHKIDVMIGCASFEGSSVGPHRAALHFLLRQTLAPAPWQVEASEGRALDLGSAPKDAPDLKKIISGLPPLIKGYLRLGCFFGRDAVADQAFNTTDVLVVLPVSNINPRYFARFGNPIN